MKNETKLEKVKKFLDENNIEYWERKKHKVGRPDIGIKDYGIHIKCQGEDDEAFYEKYKYRFPVFVRDTDAPKFVIEKIQNTIIKVMQQRQARYMKQKL